MSAAGGVCGEGSNRGLDNKLQPQNWALSFAVYSLADAREYQISKPGEPEPLDIITGARARGVQGGKSMESVSLYENPVRN